MQTIRRLCACMGATIASAVALVQLAPAFAQGFPSKPIRLVLPYPPGGSLDIFARALADSLRPLVNQTVVVDNKPGAGGTIAGALVARSLSDGYTLFVADVGPLTIARAIYKSQDFDAVRDLEPVTLGSFATLTVTVNPSLRAKTVKELIALAKAQPRKINFSSAGSGTILHMAGELFNFLARLNLQHVAYKGGGAAAMALMGGEVQVGFPSLPSILKLAEAGKVRILAVTQAKRSTLAPEIPTVAEAGVPGYEVVQWQAIVAPKGTPKDIIAKLNKGIVAALNKPETKARLAPQVLDVATSTPEELGTLMRREATQWENVVKRARIKVQ